MVVFRRKNSIATAFASDPMSAETSASWTLDPRLAGDTVALGDLPLSRALLMNDANYPWLILVPRRPHLVELIDLDETGRVTLIGEVTRASRALKAVTACDKLNVAALGNTVRQLHVHVVARLAGDAAGPRPVWGAVPPRPYDAAARDRLAGALRKALQLD
jgi:diadenosine tetraphosphate (Ap4A) HIT family hydrolase